MSTQRVKKSYRIQLTVPLAVLFLGLGGISLVAAFYLGLVAGKSLRQPPESQVVSVPSKIPVNVEEEDDALEFFNLSKEQSLQEEIDSKIFNVSKEESMLEKLDKATLNKLTRKTKELTEKKIKQTSRSEINGQTTTEAKVESKPKLKIVEQVKVPVQPAPVLVKRPEVEPPKKPVAKVKPVKPVKKVLPFEYTVQVFSASNKKNAEKIVQRLKKNGYPGAYIFKYITADSKSLYRVRVGRMNKPEINKLARRIKQLDFIDSTQVTRF